ncbi:MAG: amidohydrolase [Phaeodactylibacter sp.]|nr:amidohydrolase [Phaeodactylibacter sp.]
MNKAATLLPQETLEALIQFRRHLHAHPELAHQETETARLIVGYLVNCAPTIIHESIGGNGVLALFDSGKTGPTVLFRAELDALPIEEINDFEYRSTKDQVSHKCGHDGHATILLGLAQVLAEHPIPSGRVALLFQPAEETGEGAALVLEDPVFQELEIDFAFALHNLPGYPKHQVLVREGSFNASVKSLILRLHGKTTHAAEPAHGINPAFAIAELIGLTQTLSQPDTRRADFTLLTPIHIHLGEKAYGTAAGYGEFHLTLRCWSEAQMTQISHEIFRVVERLREKYQLTIEHEWLQAFQNNDNAAEAVHLVKAAAHAQGLSLYEPTEPFKWGEDFGLLTNKYKGALFGLGAGENHPVLHNPDYDFPDALILTGVRLFHSIASNILA